MRTDIVEKYSRALPRYTSYPTANHFSAGAGPADISRFFGLIPRGAALSLYIHIPFCHSLCHYCGCHTKVVNKSRDMARYVKALCRDIEYQAQSVPGDNPVRAVHFGGGTPNYLPVDDFRRIMSCLRDHFPVRENASLSMELDPRQMSYEKALAYAAMGINRISLGVQDFNEDVQEASGRVQPFELVEQSVTDLRASGIEQINFDLMYGLPKQTPAGIRHTVNQAVRLKPDRLAVFGYAHVPWMKRHQKLIEESDLPGPAVRYELMMTVRGSLQAAGYEPIALDHFAIPGDALLEAYKAGRMRRTFMGYTEDENPLLLGLGASAIGSVPQAFCQNEPDIRLYCEALEHNARPAYKSCFLSSRDQFRARIIESIMCFGACEIAEDFEFTPAQQAVLNRMQADGLIERPSAGHIRITPEGWPFVRWLAACFDDYFELPDIAEAPDKVKAARHSSAI